MIIVALDPGGTTGVAEIDTTLRVFSVTEIENEHHGRLYSYLDAINPETVICEGFDDRDRARETISLEYIGAAKCWCQHNAADYVEQSTSIGKEFWTDKKIKTLDLWVPAKPHAMDALRHLLYFLTFKENNTYWVKKWKDAS